MRVQRITEYGYGSLAPSIDCATISQRLSRCHTARRHAVREIEARGINLLAWDISLDYLVHRDAQCRVVVRRRPVVQIGPIRSLDREGIEKT
jgi:hypothetical protein